MALERGLFPLMLASALLPGCALQRIEPEPLPAPERVAIIAARSAPEPAFNLHARSRGEAATVRGGQGMLKGAATGALAPVAVLGRAGPIGMAVGLYLAPAGAVAGALVGGVSGAAKGAEDGIPADQADALQWIIQRALREEPLAAHLALHTAAACTRLQRQRVRYLPHVGPAGSWGAPDYRALGDFDAVLEIGVTAIGFQGLGGEAASVAFEMQLRARLVPLDGSRSRLLRYTHTGAPHPVAAWQADGGRLFQDELGAAYSALGQRLAEELSGPRRAAHAWRVVPWSPPPLSEAPAPEFSFPSSWSPSGTAP